MNSRKSEIEDIIKMYKEVRDNYKDEYDDTMRKYAADNSKPTKDEVATVNKIVNFYKKKFDEMKIEIDHAINSLERQQNANSYYNLGQLFEARGDDNDQANALNSYQNYYKTVKENKNIKEYEYAIQYILTNATATPHQRAYLFFDCAQAYLEQGEIVKAAASFNSALKNNFDKYKQMNIKEVILDHINTLPIDKQHSLLSDCCLNKTTTLGQLFWKKIGTSDCSLKKGNLNIAAKKLAYIYYVNGMNNAVSFYDARTRYVTLENLLEDNIVSEFLDPASLKQLKQTLIKSYIDAANNTNTIIEKINILTKLLANKNLEKTDKTGIKESVFEMIKKQQDADRKNLIISSLTYNPNDPNSVLYKFFWFPTGNTPCSLDRGTLREICTYAKKILPNEYESIISKAKLSQQNASSVSKSQSSKLFYHIDIETSDEELNQQYYGISTGRSNQNH
jgi:tetratricopeptide (TPR) repeat protein